MEERTRLDVPAALVVLLRAPVEGVEASLPLGADVDAWSLGLEDRAEDGADPDPDDRVSCDVGEISRCCC